MSRWNAVRAVPGNPVEAAFSIVYGRALAAGARPVLPMGRELLDTGVLARPSGAKGRAGPCRAQTTRAWPLPCASTPHAAGTACRRCGSPAGAGGRRRTP